MRIGIDLDEVLAEFVLQITQYYNNKYNTNFKKEDYKNYDLWNTWGNTKEEAVNEIALFYQTSLFDNMPLVEKSKEAILKLKENHALYIITSRQDNLRPKTLEWVEKNFQGVFDKICFSHNYLFQDNLKTKKEICDELCIDVFIEDSTTYVQECASENRQAILIDRPWNQELGNHPHIKRANDWDEIVEIIEEIENSRKPLDK